MFCTNCGANNNEGAKYCKKCGQQLSCSTASDNTFNKQKRKPRNWFLISVSLVLVVTIVIISVFDLWPWNNGVGISQDKVSSASNGEALLFENFSLGTIVDECPDCKSAMETYIEMIRVAQDWTTSKEELEILESQKCNQMQHLCTATTIQVENIPYVFRGGFGLYTGEWMGAGPSGKGTFCGTVYGNLITYEGDWGFGVPNGEGELFAESG
ncbi:MAG: zinc ribbon domain-containing protein, partial [Lachnospiraceae bacterium]|nr:zinc ribbon domain-containing protein [Lachnospiraceae bacterium]